MTPESSKRPLRPPVSWEMLAMSNSQLDHNDSKDICVLSCALVATSGQARLGELLPSCSLKHDPSQHPSVFDLQPPSTAAGSRALKLPTSKMTGHDGATIYLCSQNDCSDPNKPLDMHLRINNLPQDFPLFAYQSCGGFMALTKRHFLQRCNKVWADSERGLLPFTGHCFRIGGTTMLLLRGVSPHIVKAMGRWSLDTFLRYWRSLEVLAPKHAELLAQHAPHVLPQTED